MKPKTILNGAILFIGIGLAAYSQLNGYRLRFNVESVPVASATKDPEVATEIWQVKEGSIYDGDTLRVVRGTEEQKIRFCGIDKPKKSFVTELSENDTKKICGGGGVETGGTGGTGAKVARIGFSGLNTNTKANDYYWE